MSVSDGKMRRFKVGEVMILEDVTGPSHTTRNHGDQKSIAYMSPWLTSKGTVPNTEPPLEHFGFGPNSPRRVGWA